MVSEGIDWESTDSDEGMNVAIHVAMYICACVYVCVCVCVYILVLGQLASCVAS